LPANRELAGAEVELVSLDRRELRLRDALQAVSEDYDMVLVDCPPSLSLLTLNGLCAAHGVIIPMQCEYFALEGLSDLVNSIKRVHAGLNRDLRIIGLLRVMFDPRMTLSQQVIECDVIGSSASDFKTLMKLNDAWAAGIEVHHRIKYLHRIGVAGTDATIRCWGTEVSVIEVPVQVICIACFGCTALVIKADGIKRVLNGRTFCIL